MINQWWLVINLCSQHVSPCTHNLCLCYSLFFHLSISTLTEIIDYKVCRVDSLVNMVVKRTYWSRTCIITHLVKDTEISMVIHIATSCEHIVSGIVQTHNICIPNTFITADLIAICCIHCCKSRLSISIRLIEVTCAASCLLLNIQLIFA